MFILYDLIFLLLLVFFVPLYLFKGKFHRGFLSRLGFLPQDLKLGRPIWCHAVSVGEAMAVRGLVEELRKAYPHKRFVLSTVTSTGNKIARELAREGDLVTYLPLDFSFIVLKVIRKINPSLFIIAETELWPNLIRCLYRSKIPVIVVNGRISDASFSGYLSIKFLMQQVLNKVSLFCVQSERDAERLLKLGVGQNKIAVTGNMKFDSKPQTFNFDSLRLGLSEDEQLWVSGSTHPGEEEIILKAYKEILKKFGNLKLLIAPRHPERAGEIEKIVSAAGFRSVFISHLSDECSHCIPKPVFILDVIGKLISFYALADIVFVGGTLVKKGGHNILEPASLGKPVIFGPYMFNFRDIAELFLKNNAAILVHNGEELKKNILSLLNDPAKMLQIGKLAKGLMRQNEGATLRNTQHIGRIYGDQG